MKKRAQYGFGFFLVLLASYLSTQAPSLTIPETKVVSTPSPAPLPQPLSPEKPQTPSPERSIAQASFDPSELETNPDIPLSQNLKLVSNIGALKTHAYTPDMGPIVQTGHGLIFFRKSEATPSIHVAFDESTNRFHPVASILHLREISERIREELKSRGYQEYLYHPQLNLLSLKSTQETLLTDYQDLSSQGLHPRLEVLRNLPVKK